MKENIGNFIIANGKLFINNSCQLSNGLPNNIQLYEVMRILNGIPLFLKEHVERLLKSAAIKEISIKDKEYYYTQISECIKTNSIEYGNIKLKVEQNADKQDCYCFQIAHKYPTQEQYEQGINVALYQYEREEPQAKVLVPDWRKKAEEIKKEKNVYELLLLNNQNCITEGSKSNLFFIKDKKLYTSLSETILQGITRQKIVEVAKEKNIEIIEQEIPKYDISQFEAAFISGTSPNILAIHQIDDINYDVNNPIIKQLSTAYHLIIDKYLENARIHS
jgi:branched-chain amino acid aminotransferase